MSKLFLKTEIMCDLEKLAAAIDEGSEAVAHELATIVTSNSAECEAWQDSLNDINERRDRLDMEEGAFRDSINVRRDDLDAEETAVHAKHVQSEAAINAKITAVCARMGTVPQLVASTPKTIAILWLTRNIMSNGRKQASGGSE